MTTVQQTIDVPADRRVVLDLPETVPSGKFRVTVIFAPAEAQTDDGLSSDPFPSIEELKQEAAEKTARRRLEGRKPFEGLRESMGGRRFMGGVDGVEYQRSIRDEWPL